jgi:hypothetical protein
MLKYGSTIQGNLDIFVSLKEDEFDGKTIKWSEVLIHGDPEGLRSLAALLIKIADANQDNIANLPTGAREHIHLQPNYDLSASSEKVIIGRLDANRTGAFYNRYIPAKK